MRTKNALMIGGLLAFSWFLPSFADANKDSLLSDIDGLKSNLDSLETSKQKDLETHIQTLLQSFNSATNSGGIDSNTVAYLVSLGKISSNYSQDLKTDYTALRTEIQTLIQTELTTLTKVRDEVSFQNTITDIKKATYASSIAVIQQNYLSLSTSLTQKIDGLQSKYSLTLESYKSLLKTAIDQNAPTLESLKAFQAKFESLFNLSSDFEKNYTSFKNSYLAYAGDLSLFNESKQKEYVQMLREDLENLRDINLEKYTTLGNFQSDIDRLMEILLENFSNSLDLKMQDSYGVLFSDTDIQSLQTRFTTVKNRFYDTEGNLKPQEVLSSSGALEEVAFVETKLTEINTKIKALLGDGTTTNSVENLKIRLENEIVYFYNDNYENYRTELIQKLKEKLAFVQLETKNTILASDAIDLRFSLLNDKITKTSDLKYIKSQIKQFNKDMETYALLNSPAINKKIQSTRISFGIYITNKELAQLKYHKYSEISYHEALLPILEKLKNKYPDTYQTKLLAVVEKIDTLLEGDLSPKKSYMLLSIKSEVLSFIK